VRLAPVHRAGSPLSSALGAVGRWSRLTKDPKISRRISGSLPGHSKRERTALSSRPGNHRRREEAKEMEDKA